MDALVLDGDERRGTSAISFGEVAITFDPEISEWGNPTVFNDGYRSYDRSKPREVKHLST